jgi:hypothetical protein
LAGGARGELWEELSEEERGRIRKECAKGLFPLVEAIKRHEAGEKLVVPRVGEFNVEWHSTPDMKAAKLLNNMRTGPMVNHPSLYGMRNRNDGVWVKGVRSGKQSRKPDRDLKDPNWSPLLPISLGRWHMCTMHGACRLDKKLVHLQIQSIWDMVADTSAKEEAQNGFLRQFEDVLSEMGIQGGVCKIVKDPRQEKGNRPQKLSFKHTNARKLVSWVDWDGVETGRF